MIAKTKTPAEIMAEYERIQKEREQRRLNQRTNPRVSYIKVNTKKTSALIEMWEILQLIHLEEKKTLNCLAILQ